MRMTPSPRESTRRVVVGLLSGEVAGARLGVCHHGETIRFKKKVTYQITINTYKVGFPNAAQKKSSKPPPHTASLKPWGYEL